MFIPFVRRLQAKYRHDANITKSQMFMRPNIILELYTDSNAWHEVLHFSANRDYPSTSEEGDSSIHTVEWFVTDNTVMTNGTDLHSVQQPANPAHRRTQTRSSQRAVGIMRRLVCGPVNEGSGLCLIIQYQLVYPPLAVLNSHLLQDKPQIAKWEIPKAFVEAWERNAGHVSKKCFTDASLTQNTVNTQFKTTV